LLASADATNAQACVTASANVTAAAQQQVSAADVSAISTSIATAVSAGSTDAVLSAVRQLSAATAATSASPNSTGSASQAAQAAAAQQAEGALGVLQSLLTPGDAGGASLEESLGIASAGGWGSEVGRRARRLLCSALACSALLVHAAFALSNIFLC